MILPFSEKARQSCQCEDFSIDPQSIATATSYIERVLQRRVGEITAASLDIKTLAVSKAILSLCPYPLIARFSDHYSKMWGKFFARNETQALEFAREVFSSLSFLETIEANKTSGVVYRISVFEYLNAEEGISLTMLSNGKIFLTRGELNEVLARQVRKRVLTIPRQAAFPEEVKQAALRLSKEFALSIPKDVKNLEKEEVVKIRSGVQEGQRYYSCMKLARACFNDGLSLEEAKQVVLEFVKACPPSRNPFTEREALNCLEWMYRKGQQSVMVVNKA